MRKPLRRRLRMPRRAEQEKRGIEVTQAKSVRISLARLDDMMNSVGELVINRTRLIGRMAELKKLVEVLGISRKRLSDKVAEFQEKYEFTRLGNGNSDGGSSEPRKTAGFAQGEQQPASDGRLAGFFRSRDGPLR